jgi:hypothetical protein
MKFSNILKIILSVCTPLLIFSCSSWEEVVAPDEFKPVKVISFSTDSAYVGQNIVIHGENFIKNKEYNQVWFGGNIRGIVDSATSTQLFLKVPKGIEDGFISVSNGIYSDTLKATFKIVLKPLPFKTMQLRFGGFDAIAASTFPNDYESFSSYQEYKDLSFSWFNKVDYQTYTESQASYCFPEKFDYYNFPDESDTILQSGTKRNSSNRSPQYSILDLRIDSTNNIIPNFSFIQFNNKNYVKTDTPDAEAGSICKFNNIVLRDLPYSIIDGKKVVRLNSAEFEKHFKSFLETTHQYGYKGHNQISYERTVEQIIRFNGNAYFELTLE